MTNTFLASELLLPIAAAAQGKNVIAFGTNLGPEAQIAQSQKLAKSVIRPGAPGWRAKGDQRRTHRFPGTETNIPYRLYVPTK